MGSVRCSSCLRFQSFRVETFSSFPKCQSNGCDNAPSPFHAEPRQCKEGPATRATRSVAGWRYAFVEVVRGFAEDTSPV